MEIKNSYKVGDVIPYLEKWFDEWNKQEDWWGGTEEWDVNVFTDAFEREKDYGTKFQVSVYGLETLEDKSVQVDTANELDNFQIEINNGLLALKKPKTYKVAVQVTEMQYWEIDAKSKEDAESRWFKGDHVNTKPKTEDVEFIEEII